MITKHDFLNAIKQEPNLGQTGICTEWYLIPIDRQEDRQYLKEHCFDQFKICIEWLRNCIIIKTVNTNHTSYTAKHIAEHWAGSYVSNGAFIAAIIFLGIKYQRIGKYSPNIWVALSECEFKKIYV